MTPLHTPTNSSCWQLDQQHASLCVAGLRGQVELQHPEAGIGSLVYQGNPLPGFLFGVSIEDGEQLSFGSIREQYVRGSDLVVTYDQSEHTRPFSLQICWRACAGNAQQVGNVQQVGIDAIVSLQTNLLESHPQLFVSSRMKCEEVAGWSNAAEPSLSESNLAHCAIFRLPDDETSYLETVPSRDSVGQSIEEIDSRIYQTTWPLGGDFLEKGVIRRIRLRGRFVPQNRDVELASVLPATLETEQPPLST